jgi:hypothetical protein
VSGEGGEVFGRLVCDCRRAQLASSCMGDERRFIGLGTTPELCIRA